MKKISYFLFFLLLSSNLFSAEKQNELNKEHAPVKQKCVKLECQAFKGESVNKELQAAKKAKGKSRLNYEHE